MALSTPLDIIKLALKVSGAIGVGQTPLDEDTNDAFNVLNTILTQWQMNRWLVYDLVETSFVSTGDLSYSVGPGRNFNVPSIPDRIDAAFVRTTNSLERPYGEDTYLYPFMSREGYDRVAFKTGGDVPFSYFYDYGTLFVYPAPDVSYTIFINSKHYLGQFATLTETITLPPMYTPALLWNLAAELRPIYQLPDDPQITSRAASTLQIIINSNAQVPQITQPQPGNRAGIFSSTGNAQ